MLNYTALLFVCLFTVAMLTGMSQPPKPPVDCVNATFNAEVEAAINSQGNEWCRASSVNKITDSCIRDYKKSTRCAIKSLEE